MVNPHFLGPISDIRTLGHLATLIVDNADKSPVVGVMKQYEAFVVKTVASICEIVSAWR